MNNNTSNQKLQEEEAGGSKSIAVSKKDVSTVKRTAYGKNFWNSKTMNTDSGGEALAMAANKKHLTELDRQKYLAAIKRELGDQVRDINRLDNRGIGFMQTGHYTKALKDLLDAEALVDKLKRFWYLNAKGLGDLLECAQAYKAITLTLNNLGLLYKKID